MNNWHTHINNTRDLLLSLSVLDINGNEIDTDTAFKQLQNYALGVLERKKTIYFIGNGNSASIANYASANLAKNTGIHTETFFNFSVMTAIANGSGYEKIFSESLKKRMVSGDMLFAICGSGESQNILEAVKEALRIGGTICTFSAMNPDNSLRSFGALNFYVQADTITITDLCDMNIINYWIDQMISTVSWQEDINKMYNQYSSKYESKFTGN